MPLGQRIAHMHPEGRLSLSDSLDELLVCTGDVLSQVKRGECPRSSLPVRARPHGNAGELVQRVSPAPDRFGRRSPRKLLRAVVARLLGRKL